MYISSGNMTDCKNKTIDLGRIEEKMVKVCNICKQYSVNDIFLLRGA